MIYISFVEEAVMNPTYYDFIGGRIEVTHPEDSFHSEEIRFLTRKLKAFYRFRNKWDMKEIDRETLQKIKKIVERKFYEHAPFKELLLMAINLLDMLEGG